MNNRNNAIGALGRLQSKPQPTTQQFLKSKDTVDNWAGGTLFRASTTSTSTQGSLSPNFRSDEGNANGALAAVHGDKSWAEPAHDNGWASPVKDDGWAASVKDNGWAAASKQTGWASAVHDDGWASSPSAAASHGALMSMKDANPMGSLSQLKGHQDAWAKRPSHNEDMGGLASMASGDNRGSLAQVHGGNNMGSLAMVRGTENSMGSLSAVKTSHVNFMGSLASVKTDPETNGALSNFKQNQAETDGSLSSFKDSLDSTDGSLAGLKASNSDGSLANTRGSDAGGSLADVKSSDVWGSLSNSNDEDMANGVLSVTKNGQDIAGSLSGFSYGQDGEHVGGSLANTKGSDVGGSLAAVKGMMVNGALAVGGHVDNNEMVGGSLSAVADRPQGNGWLSKTPGLRGRLVDRGAGDAAKQALTKGAANKVAESAKQVQQTEEEAAALKYMLGKELSEASEKRAALVAEKKVKDQEAALERVLKDSKEKMEKVQSKLAKAAKQEAKGAKPTPAAASKVVEKGATMKYADTKADSQHGSNTAVKVAPASVDEGKMHVANGQVKKQRKSTKLGEEGEPLDGNEDDIGWHKSHWSTVAWVMFIMFGPVFTTAVVGLVGYYTGTVAALATCLLLVCMDIACYYYSWFLW